MQPALKYGTILYLGLMNLAWLELHLTLQIDVVRSDEAIIDVGI